MPEEVSRNRRELEDRHARNLEHLSASIAHEIRNPITAAKSLLQQMGEDPHSHENVEYAHVALQELERVERSISHLLRYARDEELRPQRAAPRRDRALGARDAARTHRPLGRRRCASTSTKPARWSATPRSCAAS